MFVGVAVGAGAGADNPSFFGRLLALDTRQVSHRHHHRLLLFFSRVVMLVLVKLEQVLVLEQ